MLLNCLLVGIGGFAGSVLRYLVGLVPLGAAGAFPFKTLAVNVAGAFAIGLLCALAARQGPGMDPRLVLALKTGVCGGFTTFSTFALETATLLQDGQTLLAAVYVLASMLLGLGATLVAEALVTTHI